DAVGATARLLKILRDTRSTGGSDAHVINTLGLIGPGASAAIAEIAKSIDESSCEWAVGIALSRMGPEGVAALLKLRDHKNKTARIWVHAGLVLARRDSRPIAVDVNQSIEAIIAYLDDGDASIRLSAVRALAEIGPPATPAARKLANLLKDKDRWVRHCSAWALVQIGPADKTLIPALLDAISDADKDTRSYAIIALAKMGPEARSAAPALAKLLVQKEGAELAYPIIMAIQSIKPDAKDVVPSLIQKLNADVAANTRGPDPLLVEVLASYGESAADAVPALIQCLTVRGKNASYLHYPAIGALGRIGPKAKPAVSALKTLSPMYSEYVHWALVRIEAANPTTVPAGDYPQQNWME
ncbi:MAG: HEAT repeat domain-containing protein, partial [Phycisphaerae bacterium]|nr:HEAT repeat domain-containing protein [Phycisphaerae bacterium]